MGNYLEFGGNLRTFSSQTNIKLQIAENIYDNKIDQKFNVHITKENSLGYLVEIQISDSTQTAKDFMSALMMDIGLINSKLLFQVDKNFKIIEVVNKKELLETWRNSISPKLQRKYSADERIKEMFKNFELQLSQNNGVLENSLKNRGFYDLIFNGLTNIDFSGKNFKINKEIPDFIDDKAISFKVKDFILEKPVIQNEQQMWLRGIGNMDWEKFDKDYLRKKIRRIVGNAIFPVKPNFEYQEAFRIDENLNQIIEARKELIFSVDGYYYSNTRNYLREIKL